MVKVGRLTTRLEILWDIKVVPPIGNAEGMMLTGLLKADRKCIYLFLQVPCVSVPLRESVSIEEDSDLPTTWFRVFHHSVIRKKLLYREPISQS